MNATVASLIITRLEDQGYGWLDVTAGLTRAITFKSKSVKGRTHTWPIACDVNDPAACSDDQLQALMPDESKRSILFIEGDRFPQRIVERGIGARYVSRLRIVGWLNCEKLGGGCSCGDQAAQNVISALRGSRYNSGHLLGIRHTVVGGGPSKGPAIFSAYTFDEARSQYLHFPFDFFAIDIETDFSVMPGCEDVLAAEDAACWASPTNPRRKHPNQFTCEELQDPDTGLTSEQLGPECLDCAGTAPCGPIEIETNSIVTELVSDPCGGTAVVRVVDQDGNPVGSQVASPGETLWQVDVGGDCPTECEVIEAAEAASVVSCTPDGNKPTLYAALTADDAITPEVIVVAMDGASKTDAVKAIICDTCDDGSFKTSDGTTTIATVPAGTSVNAGDSIIYYQDENGDTQSTAPFDTAFTGSKIYPDTVIPSREILNSDLDPAASRKATLDDLINDTVPQAIGATVQLKDSAGNDIGSADSYPANTSSNKTAPDATAVVRNSVPTTLSTTSIRSNASQNIAVADSTITKPDGTTVGLPATVALDVRNYRSGIAYQFGLKDWSGQSTVYRTGGEASLYGAGWYGYTPPVYPTSFARLSNWNTLTANNSFGNTNRFTDEAGNAAASSGNRYVIDHLSGLMWYIPNSLPSSVNWNDAVDACEAATTGGYSDWVMPPLNILMDLVQHETGVKLNYAPFNIASTLWSGTTNPDNTAQARTYNGGSAGSEGNQNKTNTQTYIYCRKHLNV